MMENSRLSDSSIDKLREIENLKKSITIKAGSQRESPKKSLAEMTELSLNHEKEISSLKNQITQLRQSLDLHKKEIEKLQEINKQRKLENEKLLYEVSLN